MNAKTPLPASRAASLRERFDALGLGIRCGYDPAQAQTIRCWLALGMKLVRAGLEPELPMRQRMLQLLLRTAHDDALPWTWRSVCLEHTALPVARLQSLLGHDDPSAVEAVHAAVQAAHERLASPSAQAPALPPIVSRQQTRS